MFHLLPALLLLQTPVAAPRPMVELPAQTRDGGQTRQPLVGNSSVSGTVVDERGHPVKNARVSLNGTASRQLISDASGAWTFDKIPEGRYTISASKTRYLAGQFGMRKPDRAGTSVQVGATDHKTGLTVMIFSPAVITGFVFGDDGEPVQNAQVRALRYTSRTGVRRLQMSGGASTDDRGMYRLYGLTPGEYVLSATGPNEGIVNGAITAEMAVAIEKAMAAGAGEAQVRIANGVLTLPGGEQMQAPSPVAFAPTYFPGVTNAAAATSVTVTGGEERSGVDITLVKAQTTTVTGVVVARGGALPPNVSLQLTSADEAGQSVPLPGTRVEADGRFTLRNVPPGQYMLVARAQTTVRQELPGVAGAGNAPVVQTVQTSSTGRTFVSVDGAPVSGVVLMLDGGRTVSGRVTFEGIVPDLTKVRFTASLQMAPTAASVTLPPPQPAQVAADGSFRIANVLPGRYTLRVSGPQWTVKSSMVAGKDSLDFPFDVDDEDVSGAVVTLAMQPAVTELSGFLMDQRNQPAEQFTIVVFAADQRYWMPSSRRVQTARPGTDGKYTLRGLPPGDYMVVAVDDIEPGTQYDPEVLKTMVPAAARVTLAEGAKVAQDLRVQISGT